MQKYNKWKKKQKRKELCEKRVFIYPKKARQKSYWQRTSWLRSHSYWVGPGGVHPCWNKLLQVSPQEREKIPEGKPRTWQWQSQPLLEKTRERSEGGKGKLRRKKEEIRKRMNIWGSVSGNFQRVEKSNVDSCNLRRDQPSMLRTFLMKHVFFVLLFFIFFIWLLYLLFLWFASLTSCDHMATGPQKIPTLTFHFNHVFILVYLFNLLFIWYSKSYIIN